MKKVVFILFIFMVNISVSKALETKIDYQDGFYSNRVDDKLFSGKLGYIYLDNELVYCIDPYLIVGKEYTLDNTFLNNINQADLEYFEVVANFGYNNTNRNDIYYYMATQELIWERIIGKNRIFWTSEQYGNGNRYDIDYFKNRILEDVNRYYLKPEFDGLYINNDLFNIMEIYDNNYVINDYELINSGKSIIERIDNKLIIDVRDSSLNEVKLKKTYSSNSSTSIYKSNNSQTLIKLKLNRVIESNFFIKSLNSYQSKIGIKFYDKDTKELIKEDVKFDLYNINDAYNYDKNYYIENCIYKYTYPFKEGIYLIKILDDSFISNSNLSFEINENINMNKYNEYIFYLEKKPIIKKRGPEVLINNNIVDPLKKVIPDLSFINDKDSSIDIEFVEKKITNNQYFEKNEIVDVLPNTYNYLNLYRILFLFMCLLGCGFYKI